MDQFGMMVGLNKNNAFEGWFTKIDDKENGLMFSVIWGYSTHNDTKHAFIQFQDNLTNNTKYISYPLEELSFKTNPFVLQIGNNELSEKGITLSFVMNDIEVKGDFSFGKFSPIKKSILKPNIMGWLTFFPNECNHSIISMHHKVNGNIKIGNKSWNIKYADGYIEKDWGTGFPKEYVWIQANEWENSSVVFSYATVPMLGKYAKGFFLVLHHEGKEYRFSSIEGSKLTNFNVTKDSFNATVKRKGVTIEIKAKQLNPVSLAAPQQGEMNSYIKESLDGTIEIILKVNKQAPIVLTSNRASIDVHF